MKATESKNEVEAFLDLYDENGQEELRDEDKIHFFPVMPIVGQVLNLSWKGKYEIKSIEWLFDDNPDVKHKYNWRTADLVIIAHKIVNEVRA